MNQNCQVKVFESTKDNVSTWMLYVFSIKMESAKLGVNEIQGE